MKKKLACILLIDDDEPTNYFNKMIIEEVDCAEHVEVVVSGKAALNYLTNSGAWAGDKTKFPQPDIIFLDINMPAMNGWEFLTKYSVLEKHHKGEIVMVMLTTSLNPDDVTRANAIPDVTGFETKPLTSEKLDLILKKYFSSYLLEAQVKENK